MEELKVDLKEKSYSIYLANNLLFSFNALLKNIYNGKRVFILTDKRVSKYHLDKLKKQLSSFVIFEVIINGYEGSKCLTVYEKTISKLLELGIKKSDLLIAFGGGVIGDLGGFIASTLFRGIKFVMIPTTLLSQIDSSVGGKVAVNFKNHKNILGAFYQPKSVFIDPSFLNTLPKKQYNNGIGELIKYGAIKNINLLTYLIENKNVDLNLILECLKIKKELVSLDEFDNNSRMLLNFGHTFGHVIELNSNLLHGEAICLGMLISIKIGIKLGITKEYIYDYLKKIIDMFMLPSNINNYKYIDFKNVLYDKKINDDYLNFVVLEDIGRAKIIKIPLDKIDEIITWI